MKNKNRIYRAAALLLVLCFISTVMISGTFAKYTSEYVGQDTALVAKWSLDVKGGQGSDSNLTLLTPSGGTVADLDLFSHAFNENIVSGAGDSKIIAPGVDGSFVLSVKNNSDVAAGVTFGFTVEGSAEGVPMEYSLSPFGTSGADVYSLEGLTAAFESVAIGDTKTQQVYWRWPYEASDAVYSGSTNATDTGLGVDSYNAATSTTDQSRTKYILTVTATATQLTPGITTP